MNDKTIFYMIFSIWQGKNEKRADFPSEHPPGNRRKNAKNHRKNTDFPFEDHILRIR